MESNHLEKSPQYHVRILSHTTLGGKYHLIVLDYRCDFRPGQAVSLGFADEGLWRYYSIATAPGDSLGILFDVKQTGTLTPRLAALRVGDYVDVSDPFGSFLRDHSKEFWVATGTGIAPFLSMVEEGSSLSNVTLIHGARNPEDFYGQEALKAALGDQYFRCASSGQGDETYPGRLTAFLKDRKLENDCQYMICGNPEMVVTVREILIQKGIQHENIVSEIYF